MNILIIDDDLMLRKAVGHNLLEAGHTVSIASNGQEAIDMLEEGKRFELVMVDVMMPVLTGPSFILQLKKYFPNKLPTIVVISGVKDGEEFLKKIDIPFDHFLPKPIDFNKLKAIISGIHPAQGNSAPVEATPANP
jgi:two-component system, cell cycle sensor histidine kinase and response regulator CckA